MASAVVLKGLMLLALVVAPASGSYLTVWEFACPPITEQYRSCGCSNINLHSGYEHVYNGTTGTLYSVADCGGGTTKRLRGYEKVCTTTGWKSVEFHC
ncbi:hypothetical protein Taro_054840 [Colocasia esculenta]|uniref:Uncharacterized protein n=1 Tax=Colocasia esculenta TaxID=4460 RepID=A0A843XSE4_COLES|nr:hypothetical protein [Colocasia esculenta]